MANRISNKPGICYHLMFQNWAKTVILAMLEARFSLKDSYKGLMTSKNSLRVSFHIKNCGVSTFSTFSISQVNILQLFWMKKKGISTNLNRESIKKKVRVSVEMTAFEGRHSLLFLVPSPSDFPNISLS